MPRFEDDLHLYMNEEGLENSVIGFSAPVLIPDGTAGYRGILDCLRITSEQEKPKDILTAYANYLGLERTKAHKSFRSASVSQYYIATLYEVLGFKKVRAIKERESLDPFDSSRIGRRVALFDETYASEAVIASVKKLYAPHINITEYQSVVDNVASQLDANIGDATGMRSRIHACYSREILPQFGLIG